MQRPIYGLDKGLVGTLNLLAPNKLPTVLNLTIAPVILECVPAAVRLMGGLVIDNYLQTPD